MKKLYPALFFFMHFPAFSVNVHFIRSDSIITSQLASGAIIRQESGFEKDFLVLHCLLKQVMPERIFEIGTCKGYGTLIMANACPHAKIISLDLPPHTPPYSMSPSDIGRLCNRPYVQVFGDSLTYEYSQHFPINAWFIDGAHDYEHVKYETIQAIQSDPQIIIYHDTDIPEVFQAVLDALEGTEYRIFRVEDTRISYAEKN